jgi:RNA recognition motif-containing protein
MESGRSQQQACSGHSCRELLTMDGPSGSAASLRCLLLNSPARPPGGRLENSARQLSKLRVQMGAIKDVSILRDQSTGTSRGCAFVIFEEQAHAAAAIAKLDKKVMLPGASSHIEVTPPPPLVDESQLEVPFC